MGYAPRVTSSDNLRPLEVTMINRTNFERETLDVKQTAPKLGVCDETIRPMVRRRAIAKIPGLRRVLIPIHRVERVLGGLAVERSASREKFCAQPSEGGVASSQGNAKTASV